MNGHELSKALRSGKRVYGTCLLSTSPRWPDAIEAAGVDLVFIDTEHVAIGRDKLSWICNTYKAKGICPVVRIPEPSPYRACMALDGGAQGIIAPYIETVEQVRELRGAVKLRPLKGERLYGATHGTIDLGDEVNDYLANFNHNAVLIINIESQAALDNLEALATEPGVDAFLVGPHDLSINLGIPEQYDHPKFMAAISKIIKTARDAGIGAGIHFSNGIEKEIIWVNEGANLVMHYTDLGLVRKALTEDFKRIREETGDTAGTDGDSSADII